MTGLIAGTAVTVLRPTAERDDLGEPTYGEPEREVVDGVLPQPGSTSDLDASRPEGTEATVTFHWPRGYGRSLRRCLVEWAGETWRIVGDPRPYLGADVPGPWDMEVEAVLVYG